MVKNNEVRKVFQADLNRVILRYIKEISLSVTLIYVDLLRDKIKYKIKQTKETFVLTLFVMTFPSNFMERCVTLSTPSILLFLLLDTSAWCEFL